MGCFEVCPSVYMLRFFLKYECWVTDLIMLFISFFFFFFGVVAYLFVS
jgi:hypothetical protein